MRLYSFVAAVALLSASLAAHADAVYTYTGQDFTTTFGRFNTSDSVSGSFTTAAPLAANRTYNNLTPLSFSFSDGIDTFTNANEDPNVTTFTFTTNASGNIVSWSFFAGTDSTHYFEVNTDGDAAISGADNQGLNRLEGSFTSNVPVTAATPEPSSFALLGTGLLGALGVARKRFA